MSVTFESAVETLKTMFPTWDEETMSAILVSNDYHVERTIEQILSMSGEIEQSDASAAARPNAAPVAVPGPTAAPGVPVAAPAPRTRTTGTTNGASGNRYRGVKIDLPEPFLRPPGWKQNRHVIADEELAMMLMDEQFQRQARELLGDDFLLDESGELHQRRPAHLQQQPLTQRDTRPSRQQQPGANNSSMLSAISSMGSAARRNLQQLAERFSQSNNEDGAGGGADGGGAARSGAQRRHSGGGSGSNSRRGSGTTGQFQNLEDEDTEVIDFGGSGANRSRHVLQSSSAGNQHGDDDEEDDPFDSENPLIQYNQGQLSNMVGNGNKKDK